MKREKCDGAMDCAECIYGVVLNITRRGVVENVEFV